MTNSSRRETKLYKDPNDKMVAGVASGFAKYFDIDTTLVRVVWVVLALGGVGILLYVILWIVLDDEPADLEGPAGEAAAEALGNNATTAAETDQGEDGFETDEDKGPFETDEGGEPDPEAGDVSAG